MLLEMSVFQSTKYGYYCKAEINFCVRGVRCWWIEKYIV